MMDDTGIKEKTPRLLTIKKAAVYTGIPVWGIRTLIWKEKIPFVKVGNRIYLDVDDIERWIEQNKTSTIKNEVDNVVI